MLAKPDSDMTDKLYINGICYDSFDIENHSSDDFGKKLKQYFGLRFARKLKMKKNVTIIVNTENDETNLLYVEVLFRFLDTRVGGVMKDEKLSNVPVDAKEGLIMVYSFSRVENQTAFDKFVRKSKGHIAMLNRYEQIAFDFVNKYPLTHFMTNEQIDFDKGLIKKDVEVNVCFVGFGPTNRQLFLKTVSNSQFFTENDKGIVHKKVRYYVYDKEKAYKDKNLNQTYFRYSIEFMKEYNVYKESAEKEGITEGSKEWNYLPLPDYPADDWCNPEYNKKLSKDDAHFKEHFNEVDINSPEFFEKLKEAVAKRGAYSYIIVAFGEDIENIDLAEKISARLKMWGDSAINAHIFAKVRSNSLSENNESDQKIIKFGFMRDAYDINKIAHNKVKEFAYLKSFKYSRDYQGDIDQRRSIAYKKWAELSQEQKLSNFTAV